MYKSKYHPSKITDEQRIALTSQYVKTPRTITIMDDDLFNALFASGGSVIETAKDLGVSHSKIYSLIRENILYQIWQYEAKYEHIISKLKSLYAHVEKIGTYLETP